MITAIIGVGNLGKAVAREPHPVALFYATDDGIAAGTVERLIGAAGLGFDPIKAGGIEAAARIEMPGAIFTRWA